MEVTKKKSLQAHVNFDNHPELYDALVRMASDDMMSQSAFLAKLVKQDADRRHALAMAALDKSAKARKPSRQPAAQE